MRRPEPVREQPANFCGHCRKWIGSNEQVKLFACCGQPRLSHDDSHDYAPPLVWLCPECRQPANTVVDREMIARVVAA